MHTTSNQEAGRVLVIDDQRANLDTAKMLLEREGHLVRCETSGEDALECLDAFRPDLILLDMMMPGMDGFEVLLELKARGALPRIPVLFVTAAHDEFTLQRAFELGAVDFVARPYRRNEMLARVNAHLRLKLTNDRLTRTAKEREELVNLVAHDLKNPLSSILFATQMLREGSVAENRLGRYYQIIEEAGKDAVAYIHDYLEERARKQVAPNPNATANLLEVANWIQDRYAEQLERSGIELTVTAPAQGAIVQAESRVLQQVVENLVTNAIKYAPNAPLELKVCKGATGFWRFAVSDQGPGLSDTKQRQLFKPFVRFHSEHASDAENMISSGLGLSLAKKTIEALGGQLWYERQPAGGSTFVLELPEAAASSLPQMA